jgi:hypothetical protein
LSDPDDEDELDPDLAFEEDMWLIGIIESGGVDAEEFLQEDDDVHAQRQQIAAQEKEHLIEGGHSITCGEGRDRIVWHIVADSVPDANSRPEYEKAGV